MTSQRITEISVTPITAFYRKELGKNAYGDNIGLSRTEWLVRARTEGGLEGLTIANRFMRPFTSFRQPEGKLESLMGLLREVFLGRHVNEFLETANGVVTVVKPSFREAFSRHGWMSILAFDLLGRELGVSCIDLLGGRKRDRIDAYDTTMYFQDILHPESGVAQLAAEAREAVGAGYRQIKIKVGRGGRWMLPRDGARRDIEVVRAIHDAAGPGVKLMVDANFGYDGHLDLLEEFIRETVDADLFWLEEMVTADVADYRAMRTMLEKYASEAMLVCGEVDREPISPVFRHLIDQGLIDGYQPDIVGAGFSRWQDIERQLASTSVKSVPHNFGNGNFGTRADIIFGAASRTFVTLEDERCHPHVYRADGFTFEDGSYAIADAPGLGLELDEEKFQKGYARHEVKVRA